MEDYLIRATAADGQIRAFAVTTRSMVEEARRAHNTSPVATAALGRLLSGGVMMGCMMKNDSDVLTINVRGDGEIGGVTVTADSRGNAKGYVINPDVMLPASAKGKLDVGGAVGKGYINVIKDIGLKEPYVGRVNLVSGEIAEDLTYYFAVSEQTPSSVALGVLMNRDNTVAQAGGFVLQLLPGASEEVISTLEKRLSETAPVTAMLSGGKTPETILEELLSDMKPEINDRMPVRFSCNCDKARVEKVLVSIGREEIRDMIDEGNPVELKCHFCGKAYTFSVEELEGILASLQ
ncbi:MAG: Hsp33 family molecular chaperone HslO [Alistipes sp.]|nr:Hsp33 family molecular chaperone HslO [Alistipes sp.]